MPILQVSVIPWVVRHARTVNGIRLSLSVGPETARVAHSSLGSGIAAPSLVREVKPQYTEDARRLGVEGDVVLEIVVRSDGSVGQVSIIQRLGSGLDQRAVDAVRQWRFTPARRYGTPVDVLVEVAVEFKLR